MNKELLCCEKYDDFVKVKIFELDAVGRWWIVDGETGDGVCEIECCPFCGWTLYPSELNKEMRRALNKPSPLWESLQKKK